MAVAASACGERITCFSPKEHMVQHSGVQDVRGQRAGPFIVLRDPDNIQIELAACWQPSV
jgi:hypothetical protein